MTRWMLSTADEFASITLHDSGACIATAVFAVSITPSERSRCTSVPAGRGVNVMNCPCIATRCVAPTRAVPSASSRTHMSCSGA